MKFLVPGVHAILVFCLRRLYAVLVELECSNKCTVWPEGHFSLVALELQLKVFKLRILLNAM